MPTYTAQCPACLHRFPIFRRIADRNIPANCEKCQTECVRVVDAPRVVVDYAPYNCPITGKEIRGRREHEENLARHGCRVYEPGELDEHKKYRAVQEEQQLDTIAESAADLALSLPEEKLQTLAAELENGAEAPLVRTTLT